MSVTDQQKGNNAAHFILPVKVIKQVTIQKMHSPKSAVPFLQCFQLIFTQKCIRIGTKRYYLTGKVLYQHMYEWYHNKKKTVI